MKGVNRKVCAPLHVGFWIFNFGIGELGSLRERGEFIYRALGGAVILCRWHSEIAAGAAVILSLRLSDIALLTQSSGG